MNDRTTAAFKDGMTPAIRRYLTWLGISMSLYGALLATSLIALRQVPDDVMPLRAAFGLLPVLPLLMLVWAFARYVREADEMQRQIELQSVALAAMVVGIGYMVVGFLASAGVIAPKADLLAILVLPSLFGSYGIAKAFVHRSYAA